MSLAFFTLLGTAFAVASSHVFNQIIDRDVDAIMRRTRQRPVAAGRISVATATIYGTVLGLLSLVIMAWQTNLLAVLLTFAGWFIYVVIYSYWLKRRSPWCTLAGGFSGAMPTLIGWGSRHGLVGAYPPALFRPHDRLAKSTLFRPLPFPEGGYERAKLAVVVVRHGVKTTLQRIVLHIPLLLLCTISLSVLGVGGPVYLGVTLAVGAAYLAWAIKAQRDTETSAAAWGKRLFHFSYVYLLVVFAFAVI